MAEKRNVSLSIFLKGSTDPKAGMPGCANYDHHYGGCLFDEKCKVEQGKRCSYFEQAVLPTAADIGMTDKIYFLYEKQCKVSSPLKRVQKRICPDCGTGLKPRQKLCDNCRRKHRQQTNRENQRRNYAKRRASA